MEVTILHTRKTYGALDRFRLLAALLVIAIHTSPLADFSSDADFFLTRILARLAVPFFLMVTGQFVLSNLWNPDGSVNRQTQAYDSIKCSLKKMLTLYGISILLYLPLGLYADHYQNLSFPVLARMLLFDGTFYHLWYFPATILGTLLLLCLARFFSRKAAGCVVAFLYVVGLFGDSYYGFIEEIPALHTIYDGIFCFSSHTRNGLFFAPLFLLLGTQCGHRKPHLPRRILGAGFLGSYALLTLEGFVLHNLKVQRHDSMYLMLIPAMIFFYEFLLSCRMPSAKKARDVSTWVYILHPAVIVGVRLVGKQLDMTNLVVDNHLIHFLLVAALSFPAALILTELPHAGETFCLKFSPGAMPPSAPMFTSYPKDRAWIELDTDALEKNVRFLQSRLPADCTLMPVVKANAYGHGAVPIAGALNRLGIKSFCVACIEEGIELRKNGIRGEILILGFTHPKLFPLLHRYHLTQTILDFRYAALLDRCGKKVHVHLGIDTGMHRLGEPAENFDAICRIFSLKNLIVDGIFTHLSADDVLSPAEKAFTRKQADLFFALLDRLRAQGYSVPKYHLLASYGILNYPEYGGDYARAGIALYGVLSTKDDTTHWAEELSAVLSLKARVASTKCLHAGENAGYGLDYTAPREMRIAALSIGYADGLPRALSNGAGSVLINGHFAPIIGRICMDQTLVDISDIPDVNTGTIATIIGSSGAYHISGASLADAAGTIANEIYSRLGCRLPRIPLRPSN